MTSTITKTNNSITRSFEDDKFLLPQLKSLNKTWIFSEDAVINNSPTRHQKLTISQELKNKESMHDFLIRLGQKLKVDGRTILAATIYLHRFYMRVPISQSKYYVVSAALTISCKLNDNYRTPDKVALLSCNVKLPPNAKPIDEQSEMYWRWKDQLLFREELMLRKLNFDLNLTLPYEIRDHIFKNFMLLDQEDELVKLFSTHKLDILKMTTSLIESLSSLPVILCYEMNIIFGTCLIITILEGKKIIDEKLNIPTAFLYRFLDTDSETCLKCFHFIKNLLKFSQDDPHIISNKASAKRLLDIRSRTFHEIAKQGDLKQPQPQPQQHENETTTKEKKPEDNQGEGNNATEKIENGHTTNSTNTDPKSQDNKVDEIDKKEAKEINKSETQDDHTQERSTIAAENKVPDTESNVTKSEITKSNNEIMAEKNPDVKDSNSNSDDTGYTSNQLEQGKDTKNEELEKTLDSEKISTPNNGTTTDKPAADLHDSTNGTNENSIGEKRVLEQDSNDTNVDSPSSKIAKVE